MTTNGTAQTLWTPGASMGRFASPPTPTLADELADYLEALVITQGHGVGESVLLMPWEKRFMRGTFAPDVLTGCDHRCAK